jgi:CO/xanthine dehydrogenase Mo-binding subunit
MNRPVLGEGVERLDILTKVQGQRKYPQDFSMESMAHAVVVWSDRPHARIRRLDVAAARALPGVVAVLTHEDVPVNQYGINIMDQEVLQSQVVRWTGDRLAVVVAETQRIAEQARDLVQVEYEDLPVVTDPRAARAPGAPLVHTEGDEKTNLLAHIPVRRGNVDEGFAAADVIVDGYYETPYVEHAFLQPEAALGYYDEQGRITLIVAAQWPDDDLRQLAHALALREDQVREIIPAVGGAFGGREDISLQILVALAVLRTRRPVKMVWTREESIRGHGKRHPFYMKHRWGATRDGKLTAVQVEAVLDAGAYASSSVPVLSNAVSFLAGPYAVPNVHLDGYAIYTNNAITMAMRGFGATQPPVGYECQMDKLAQLLQMDPVEIRMRNLLEEGSVAVTGNRMPAGTAIKETLRAAALAAGWRETAHGWQRPEVAPGPDPHKRRGLGVACAHKNIGYSFGFRDTSTAIVDLTLGAGGAIQRALVRCAAVEVGQGSMTALAQLAAQALGIPLDNVRMGIVDTATVPNAGSSSASRHTFMSGNAVVRACQAALGKRDEAWRRGQGPGKVQAQYTYEGGMARQTGRYAAGTGQCEPHISYGYGTQIALLDVDTETGQVDLVRLYAATNVGKVVNPQTSYGQVAGGVHMGVGFGLTEEFIQVDGRIKTAHLSEYQIPTMADMPRELVSILTEVPDPNGPYGATGLGETPTLPTAAAILNGIHDATGAWLDRVPATAERVWLALNGAQPS